jgi:four helix bundle protein
MQEREELNNRTKAYTKRVMRLVDSLPQGRTAEALSKQLLHSATSVGAHYRSACRANSTDDFIAKMGIVEADANDCLYWMELLVESGLVAEKKLTSLIEEGNALIAITTASINTARQRTASPQPAQSR